MSTATFLSFLLFLPLLLPLALALSFPRPISAEQPAPPSPQTDLASAPPIPKGGAMIAAMPLSLSDEFVFIHNHTYLFEFGANYNYTRDGWAVSCCYILPNGTAVTTPVVRMFRQNVHCAHPPPELRPALVGQPVTISLATRTHNFTVFPTWVRYTYEPLQPHPFDGISPGVPATNRRHFLCGCMTLWYRTDFLYEWLLYYRHVHNLTKLFIYDNNSEIDDLRGTHSWLSLLFNVEYVHHPLYMAQYGHIAHCALKAMAECEWTTFVDIDEFFVDLSTGSLSSNFPRLASNTLTNRTGVVTATWLQIRHNDILDDMPAGGVLRNFRCGMGFDNSKFILRAGAVKRNVPTKVHHISVQSGWETRHRGGALMHYTLLSRNVFLRKMKRRSSPWTDSRFLSYSNMTARMREMYDSNFNSRKHICKHTPASYEVLLCQASRKFVADGPSGRTCKALQRFGIEAVRALGVAGVRGGAGAGLSVVRVSGSVPGVTKIVVVGRARDPSEPRFRNIVHVVEHPMAGVAALMRELQAEDDEAGNGMVWAANPETDATLTQKSQEPGSFFRRPPSLLLLMAALEWMNMHQYFELVTDAIVRIEDVRSCEDLCGGIVGITGCQKLMVAAGCKLDDANRTGPQAAWPELWSINSHLTQAIAAMAARYNYTVPPLPAVRTDEPPLLSEDQWPGGMHRAATSFFRLFSVARHDAEMNSPFEELRQQVDGLVRVLPPTESRQATLAGIVPVEAVAVLPHHTTASSALSGLIFRAATRRQLRIFSRDSAYSFRQLATVDQHRLSASVAVLPPSVELASATGANNLFNARQFFDHVIGTSAKLITVWDDPVSNYVATIHADTAVLKNDTWQHGTLEAAVDQCRHPNPLANSLGLHDESEVLTFIDHGMPGLDLVLLSARWNSSLAVLRRYFHWDVIDVMDGHVEDDLRQLPAVYGIRGVVLAKRVAMPGISPALREKIVSLTTLDHLLYAAAEKRLSALESQLSAGGSTTVSAEAQLLAGLNAQLHKACTIRPQHPTCIYWQQLSVGRLHSLLSPSGRAPALDLGGAPCFSYLHRAWQAMSST